jgi:plastocyanin
MEKTLFFVFGITLIVAALALAGAGLRNKDFPSPAVFRALVPSFAILVGATATFAVLNASANTEERAHNNEAAKRVHEQGSQTAVQEADNPNSTSTTGSAPPSSAAKPSAPSETLKVTSPASGELKYDPSTLTAAKPGNITIDYDNPSPVPHSIAIGPEGSTEIIDQSDVGASATFTVTADLKAGTYVYFCTVPGHREAGMEGKLTVK